jgi:argininosuccinate lyase
MKKLWGGRFSKGPKKEVLEFNSAENIELDNKLVKTGEVEIMSLVMR